MTLPTGGQPNQSNVAPPRCLTALTLREAARILHLDPMTLYKLCRAKKVPCSKIGGQWRFHPYLLDDWFHAKCQANVTGEGTGGQP